MPGWAACHEGEKPPSSPSRDFLDSLERARDAYLRPPDNVGRLLLTREQEARTRAELEHAGPGLTLEQLVDEIARRYGYASGVVEIIGDLVEP